jgi:hypothetical protein
MATPIPVDADATPNYTPAQHATWHNAFAAFYNAALKGAGLTDTKTGNYTVLVTDAVVFCDASSGAFTVTLPAVAAGLMVAVKKIDSSANIVTIAPASGLIDGSATDAITVQWQARTYVSNGTNWFKV